MKDIQVYTSFIPRDYDIFGGLDVDKKSISVTFNDHAKLVKSMKIPYSSGHLLSYVRKHFEGQKIAFAYEAGPTGYKLHDELTAQGYRCLVVTPSMVPTAPGLRVKTNRLDSKKISESLRGGQLKSIHIPSDSYRELRHLTQLRDTFVRQTTATKCRIKALLLFEGIDYPKAPQNSQWSSLVIKQLEALPIKGAVRFKLDQHLNMLEFTKNQVVKVQRQIRSFCQQDEELRRCIEFLTSIPGVGWIVASHLLARIGDWRQIKNVRQISSFLGLVPREDSTGEDTRRGPITRTGDSRMRGQLIQGAWASIRKDPELEEFYKRIYQRHPKDRAARKAIVAVARKLTTRMYSVLKEQRKYVVGKRVSSATLNVEETACPRERLDASQNQED